MELETPSLITLERAQKLDLLIHLITNLRQSLVLCGPQGIGKSTLLKQLDVRKREFWAICILNGSSDLSFEKTQAQLLHFLKNRQQGHDNQDLSFVISELERQNQKIVLIIEDAGQLVPGLVTALIQFASANAGIRLVFLLTHDELHIKTSSDSLIDDCHFIEIPPLTEKQCGAFLQNLSTQPKALIALDSINDTLIEKLYNETHGIPGSIIAELPKLSSYKGGSEYKWGLSAVILIVVCAISVKLFYSFESASNVSTAKNKKVVVSQRVDDIKTTLTEKKVIVSVKEKDLSIELPIERLENNKTINNGQKPQAISKLLNESAGEMREQEGSKKLALIKKKKQVVRLEEKEEEKTGVTVKHKAEVEKKQKVKLAQVNKLIVIKKEVKAKEQDNKRIKKIIANKEKKEDREWVFRQPRKNYTIQIMVLSKYSSVLSFLQKNRSLNEQLRFYSINKKGQKKYMMIYGSYEKMALASNKMKLLPVKFRKSWVRRFSSLQKEITIND